MLVSLEWSTMSTSGCSSREVTGGQRPFCAIWRGASTQSASSRATRSSQITGECGGTDNWQERPRRRLICLRRRKRARQRKDQRGAGIELRVKIIVELLRLHLPADRGVFANVCDFCRGLEWIYSFVTSSVMSTLIFFPRSLGCQLQLPSHGCFFVHHWISRCPHFHIQSSLHRVRILKFFQCKPREPAIVDTHPSRF
jgi:hypothetical protein